MPALAFHNEQLQASAFREQYDPESFVDLTLPKYDMISKVSCFALFYVFSHNSCRPRYPQRAGKLITDWKEALMNEGTVDVTTIGVKRKAVRLTLFFANRLTVACRRQAWVLMKPSFAVKMKWECLGR